jgi:hypothetical protein
MLSPIDTQNITKFEEPLTPVTALPPLPIEVYPRVLVPRKRKWDYYITLVVISFIRLITPLSAYVQPTIALTIRIYLIIFPVIVPRLRGANRIIACLLAFYALAEVIFAGYYAYLVRQVQSRPVGAKVPDGSRDAMVQRILAMDLSSPRTGKNGARGIEKDYTITMADSESGSTLADGYGGREGMSEKSGNTTSFSATSQRATGKMAEKTDQGAPLRNESAVEFRERLRTW